MITTTLKVIDLHKGLGTLKSSYVVKYNNVERRVPLFKFQIGQPVPTSIKCDINGTKVTQNIETLYKYYFQDKEIAYTLSVKNRWEHLEYYELEDARCKEENIKFKLPFFSTSFTLAPNDTVLCKVKEIKDGKIKFDVIAQNPINIPFLTIEEVFGPHRQEVADSLVTWLMLTPQLKDAYNKYNAQDGSWIAALAPQINVLMYQLLDNRLDGLTNKESISLIETLCEGWMQALTGSSVIYDLNDEKIKQVLISSIHTCEEFVQAWREAQGINVIDSIVASLKPNFYQYNIKRKFKTLSMAYLINKDYQNFPINDILRWVQSYVSNDNQDCELLQDIAYLLRLYIGRTTLCPWESHSPQLPSIPLHRSCATAQCFFVKIIHMLGENWFGSWTERHCILELYRSLSLLAADQSNSAKLLSYGYRALFASKLPVHSFRWADVLSSVKAELYRHTPEVLECCKDKTIVLSTLNGVSLTCNEQSIILSKNLPNFVLTELFSFGGVTFSMSVPKKLAKQLATINKRPIDQLETLWNNVKNEFLSQGDSRGEGDWFLGQEIIYHLLLLAETEADLSLRYNVVSACRLFTTIFYGEETSRSTAHELGRLCELKVKYILLLAHFAENSKILKADKTKFLKFVEQEDMAKFSKAQEYKAIVEILSYYNNKTVSSHEAQKLLFGVFVSQEASLISELARLVGGQLLFNELNSQMPNEDITQQIQSLLSIKMQASVLPNLGEESQTMEFKTSLIYPAGAGCKLDVQKQGDVISNVIHAMMNTEGGTLYIGANDNGDVVGLKEDLKYFSNNNKFDEKKTMDCFKNTFSSTLTQHIGAKAAAEVHADFIVYGDKKVFKISIPQRRGMVPDTLVRVGTTVQKVTE